MKSKRRVLWCTSTFVAVALVLLVPPAGAADESQSEYLTAEEYIELARPYLHLSCEAAWAMVDEDPDEYVAIIDKVSAIGFLNHDLDIEEIYQQSEGDVEALRIAYYTGVGDYCRENPNNLLAGVVERALLQAFTKIAPEAIDD